MIKALKNINSEHNYDPLLATIQREIFKFDAGLVSDLVVGVPLPPMLAKSISSFDDLVNKFLKKFTSKKVSLELKYDGERT